MIAPAVPNPNGDYDNDGIVNAADYTIWRDRLGTTFSQSHYGTWRANFGKPLGGGGVAVPEASVASFIAMGITAFAVVSFIQHHKRLQ
jgi:hypothetical protein